MDWNRGNCVPKELKAGHSPRGSVDWNANIYTGTYLVCCHSPRGSVDWNFLLIIPYLLQKVTPLVGVWIEIKGWDYHLRYTGVTPLVGVWIEISSKKKVTHANICHSPRGSVDWNSSVISATTKAVVTPLVGVWIEIKLVIAPWGVSLCHSPRGSVDWNLDHVRCRPDLLKSLPSWECGLKYNMILSVILLVVVTPLVGVWIEIQSCHEYY